VLDFGISKVVEEAAKQNLELTKTNAMMGSALYMSLEQMRDARKVDHRTDIYALGITLYELLTGTHPFTADTFLQLSVKVSLDPPEPIRTHRPDVPDDLAEVIALAYARHPNSGIRAWVRSRRPRAVSRTTRRSARSSSWSATSARRPRSRRR